MIPVSVIVVTKNAAQLIDGCLKSLTPFHDIWVIDSESRDGTASIAENHGVQVVHYKWNGQYPKKRQWCLDTLPLKYEWVLFVDADELIPESLIEEIRTLLSSSPSEAGFFITGKYRINGKVLQFGWNNKKIALLHCKRMAFPVVNDLDIPGMGEIEGHYQPVLKPNTLHLKIGILKNYMIHDALEDKRAWTFRHEKYARWEAGMNVKNAWPIDPVSWRETLKKFLRRSKYRAEIIFVVGYILRLGVLDGKAGLNLAQMRYHYLNKIKELNRPF